MKVDGKRCRKKRGNDDEFCHIHKVRQLRVDSNNGD
jgi:hypothetical protein